MPVAPCKGCPDRHLNCHSVCKPYLDYRKEQDDTNAWLRSQAQALADNACYKYDTNRPSGVNRRKSRRKRKR